MEINDYVTFRFLGQRTGVFPRLCRSMRDRWVEGVNKVYEHFYIQLYCR